MLPMLAHRDKGGEKTINDFADELAELRILAEQALSMEAPPSPTDAERISKKIARLAEFFSEGNVHYKVFAEEIVANENAHAAAAYELAADHAKHTLLWAAETINGGEYKTITSHAFVPTVMKQILGLAKTNALAKVKQRERLSEAEWRVNHWPLLGPFQDKENLKKYIAGREQENTDRVATLRRELSGEPEQQREPQDE
jgi:hypothetical protein